MKSISCGRLRIASYIFVMLWYAASALVTDATGVEAKRRVADEFKYVIDDPNINWTGYRIEMDYELSAPSTNDYVRYAVYSDKYCQGGLISEEEIEPSLVTSNGSARLSLLLNPYKINGKRYVTYEGDYATVNICVRLWVTGANSETLSDPYDKYVIIKADLKDMNGIEAILDDKSKYWGLDLYHCDDRQIEILNPVPTIQNGQKFRLCIRPTRATTDDGIFINRIHSFRFERGDVIQAAVTPYEIDEVTEVECSPGIPICTIESVLSNEFFWGTGEVKAEGSIFLQYGRQIEGDGRLLRQPIKVDFSSSFRSRSLIGYKPGEVVGSKPAVNMIKVTPNNNLYKAEAFRCDIDNNAIPMDNKLQRGQQVKICIQPVFEAQRDGVFMNSIESFTFGRENDDLTQLAIDSKGYGAKDGSTEVNCSSGKKVCWFKTALNADFFTEGADMVALGTANLQFGGHHNQRQQDFEEMDDAWRLDDLGFAGRVEVEAYFDIKGYRRKKESSYFSILGLNENQMKVLYIVSGLLLGLCLLCCLLSCFFFCYRRRQERREEERKHVPSNINIDDSGMDSRSTIVDEERMSGFDTEEEEKAQMKSNYMKGKNDSQRFRPRSDRSRSERSSVRTRSARVMNDSIQSRRMSMEGTLRDGSESYEASENYGDDDSNPRRGDVCFDADEHPGTRAFLDAIHQTIDALGPIPYSPAVYKSIKRQLPGRRFFVCDEYDSNADSASFTEDKEYEWREVTKRELIDRFWKYYEEEKVAKAVRMP